MSENCFSYGEQKVFNTNLLSLLLEQFSPQYLCGFHSLNHKSIGSNARQNKMLNKKKTSKIYEKVVENKR